MCDDDITHAARVNAESGFIDSYKMKKYFFRTAKISTLNFISKFIL